MRHARLLKERNVPDIAESKRVALVEVGAGPSGWQVKRIDEAAVAAVGGIIDRMAVGVGHVEFQSADIAANGHLQAVIARGGGLLQAGDATVAGVGAEWISYRAASCYAEVHGGSGGQSARHCRRIVLNRRPARSRCSRRDAPYVERGPAVVRTDGLARLI